MAMIALVERFSQRIARIPVRRGDRRVTDAGAPGDVDGPAAKMIAVAHAPDAAVPLWRAVGAGDPAPGRANGDDCADVDRARAGRDAGTGSWVNAHG